MDLSSGDVADEVNPPDPQFVRRSWHEASHAILGWLFLGEPPDRVELRRPHPGVNAGTDYRSYLRKLWQVPDVYLKPGHEVKAKAVILHLLAGERALLLVGNSAAHAVTADDRTMARTYLKCLDPGQPFNEGWLAPYRDTVEAALKEDRVWHLVEAAARALRESPRKGLWREDLESAFGDDVAELADVSLRLFVPALLPPN